MNNKGQTLVIFVLFIPLIVYVIILINNKSNMYYEKRQMENIAKESIRYGLNNIENENVEENIKKFINKNLECTNTVYIENNEIKVEITKESNVVKKILGFGTIKVKYKGIIDEKRIEVDYGN